MQLLIAVSFFPLPETKCLASLYIIVRIVVDVAKLCFIQFVMRQEHQDSADLWRVSIGAFAEKIKINCIGVLYVLYCNLKIIKIG